MMKKNILTNLSRIILLMTLFAGNEIYAKTAINQDTPVEVIEIKEVGVFDNDETKSVIEIRWRINPALTANVRSFKILLSVIYADGTTNIVTRYADQESVTAQIEVPSVSFSTRNAPAFIKNLKAVVIAESMKNSN